MRLREQPRVSHLGGEQKAPTSVRPSIPARRASAPYSGAASLFEAFGIDGKHSATVAALIGIGSRDELEGMMAAQFDRRSQRFDGVLPARHDR
jgi:hypothetical protein